MSAVGGIAPKANVSVDGIRRYHTRIKVVINSHNHPDPFYVSDDVVSCSIAKNIKGTGRANIALVAHKSYLNLVYPNDYIHIYFDIGDGSGWTRTFFGLIDRVEEDYTVADSGQPTTLYHVICSDFQKIVEQTNVYFNPQLSLREDLKAEDFGAINFGGAALYMKGLTLNGTPADVVQNMITVQLGFGGQWGLPESYRPKVEPRFRDVKKQYAQNMLLRNVRNFIKPELFERLQELIQSPGGLAEQEALARGDVSGSQFDAVRNTTTEAETRQALSEAGLDPNSLTDREVTQIRRAEDSQALTQTLYNIRLRQRLFGDDVNNISAEALNEQLAIYYGQLNSIETNGRTFSDVLNMFDFVERRAIDGYAFDLSLWGKNGSLLNLIRGFSNEEINELIFDLRPMNALPENVEDETSPLAAGTNWDRGPDEIGGNAPDPVNQIPGVKYYPAIVMREYPFSTIHKVDLSSVEVRVGQEDDNGTLPDTYGYLEFGAIFSNEPNVPGRHLVRMPAITPAEVLVDGGRYTSPYTKKHLDVAVVSETEIRQSRFGRTDHDHYNLFEMTTDITGVTGKYLMKDILPIVSPIHIMRNGLRVRSVTTRFARFSPNNVKHTRNITQPSEAPEAEQVEENQEVPVANSTELVPPVGANPNLFFPNVRSNKYGYRPKSAYSKWIFHNGIDIGGPHAAVDIVAIADGEVVCSAPNGTAGLSRYGNTVVIYHPQFQGPNGEKIYSLYAHLHSIEPKFKNSTETRRMPYVAAEGHHPGGRFFEPIPVRKGEVIGKMGITDGTPANPNSTFAAGPGASHLHFEIDFRWPPIHKADTPDVPFSAVAGSYSNQSQVVPYVQNTLRKRGTNSRNMDPVEFFANNGVDLVAAIQALTVDASVGDEDAIDTPTDGGGEGDDIDNTPLARQQTDVTDDVATTQAVTAASPNGFIATVDGVDYRKQLVRWALLQDHWYQHNLEYLSGSIAMRGAPEIRVGYRLDIQERNMSFYVESVSHQWNYPNEMTTTLQVTRGQPNNPFPAYSLPHVSGLVEGNNARRATSRLSQFFISPDPIAVRRALVFREGRPENAPVTFKGRSENYNEGNLFDDPAVWEVFNYGEFPDGLIPAQMTDRATTLDSTRAFEATMEQLLQVGYSRAEIADLLGIDVDEVPDTVSADQLSSVNGASGWDSAGATDLEGISRNIG